MTCVFTLLLKILGNEFDVMSRKVLCAANEELAKELSSILIHAKFDREC